MRSLLLSTMPTSTSGFSNVAAGVKHVRDARPGEADVAAEPGGGRACGVGERGYAGRRTLSESPTLAAW